MVNKIILIGRVGKKPEVYQVGDGQVCNFSLATSKAWTDKNGQRQEQTVWHRVAVWGKQATSCGEFLDKGSMVYVEGSLEIREYKDKTGAQQKIAEVRAQVVRFLSGKNSGDAGQPSHTQPHRQQPFGDATGPVDHRPSMDDDIPF